MYLQSIMSNYLNEEKKFEVQNSFKPLAVKKSNWNNEEKKLTRSYDFDDNKFLEYFIVELLKYNREADAEIEIRFFKNKVGIIIHALSSSISEIEIQASKDIDKIKKDVMYYHASK